MNSAKLFSQKHSKECIFLRKMSQFHVDRNILYLFYQTVIESVLLFSCVVWYGSCRKGDFIKLQRIAKQAGKLTEVIRSRDELCITRILKQVDEILRNENHPLYKCYTLMRSGKRLRSLSCRTQRFFNSYVPLSIRLYNEANQ